MRRSTGAIARAPWAVNPPRYTHRTRSRTDAEMIAIADGALEAILAQLVQRTA
jgi:hypothetical protein